MASQFWVWYGQRFREITIGLDNKKRDDGCVKKFQTPFMDDPLILRTANAVCRKESWTNFLAKKKKRKLLFRTNQKS
jgi:hypothetical protein